MNFTVHLLAVAGTSSFGRKLRTKETKIFFTLYFWSVKMCFKSRITSTRKSRNGHYCFFFFKFGLIVSSTPDLLGGLLIYANH